MRLTGRLAFLIRDADGDASITAGSAKQNGLERGRLARAIAARVGVG